MIYDDKSIEFILSNSTEDVPHAYLLLKQTNLRKQINTMSILLGKNRAYPLHKAFAELFSRCYRIPFELCRFVMLCFLVI